MGGGQVKKIGSVPASNKAVAKAPIIHPARWSYSSWSTMDQCPQKYYRRYVLREADKQSYAAARGEDIHAKAEHYLLGNITGMPKPLAAFSSEFKALKEAQPRVEAWLSVDAKWAPADKDTSWCVGKTDADVVVGTEMTVIDFKSGKVYPDKHALQGSLYAALASALPTVKTVHVEFWYLDKNELLQWDYTAKDLKKERDEWVERGQVMQATTTFPAVPSYLCKWCPYSTVHGGSGTCAEG